MKSTSQRCVNAGHECSEISALCHGNPALLAEFHRDVMGMHQEIDLNKTEEGSLEELNVLTTRINFTALATCN